MAQVFANATDGRTFERRLADAQNYVEAAAFVSALWVELGKLAELDQDIFGELYAKRSAEYNRAVARMVAMPDFPRF